MLALWSFVVVQQQRIQLISMRMWVGSLVSISWLRIWRCHGCGVGRQLQLRCFFFFFFYLFAISWATPVAYEGSRARGRIGAVATGLRQSHSNAGSEPRL